MIRLTNIKTGVVVVVDEATATRLGPDWRPAPVSKSARRAKAKVRR
ncbi:hypothetical protein [Cutibacterium sp.]|nr:hypothetical protein [Cutibacterium sp.]MDO4413066.1 hypothetical protein [Cutibacterium sp.]